MYVSIRIILVRRTISQLTRLIRSKYVGMRILSVPSLKIFLLISKMPLYFVKCLVSKPHCMIAGMEYPAGKLKACPKEKQTITLHKVNKNAKHKNPS